MNTRYTVHMATSTEALLLALLASRLDWSVSTVSPHSWDGYNWVHMDIEDRYINGRTEPYDAQVVDLEKFRDLLVNAPRVITVSMDEDDDYPAKVELDGSGATINNNFISADRILAVAKLMTARGSKPTGKQEVGTLVLDGENSVRLAAALALTSPVGWNLPAPTRYNWEGHNSIELGYREKNGWGAVYDKDSDMTDVNKLSLEQFMDVIKNPPKYTRVEFEREGYTGFISPDGGLLHIGCQAWTAEKVLELASHMKVPEAVIGNEKRNWHNPQHLTDEQIGVAEGWRLLDLDEYTDGTRVPEVVGIERNEEGGVWHDHFGRGYRANSTSRAYRTKFTREQLAARRRGELVDVPAPAPALDPNAVAKGRNLHRLTNEQVGVAAGYRLLDEDEIRDDGNSVREIDAWVTSSGVWDPLNNGNSSGLTYRTRLSREELLRVRGLTPTSGMAVPA